MDPIGQFQAIRDFYISYLETAFRIGDADVQARRRVLLETPGTLCTSPYLEPIPRYMTAGFGIEAFAKECGKELLPTLSQAEREAFVHLAAAGLIESHGGSIGGELPIGAFDLYAHQAQATSRGVAGEPTIVTSGTGSGKTEAFLLPVFATIAKEAVHWPKSAHLNPGPKWWRDSETRPYSSWSDLKRKKGKLEEIFEFRRVGESPARPKAVRALVLYPMNALVEDQLVRLRRALDSDQAHRVMDHYIGGNRIFFGRYTSATPVTDFKDHPRQPNRAKLARKLEELFVDFSRADQTARKAIEEALRSDDPDLTIQLSSVGWWRTPVAMGYAGDAARSVDYQHLDAECNARTRGRFADLGPNQELDRIGR